MSEYVWNNKVSRRTKYKQRQDEKEAQAKDAESFLEAIGADLEPIPFKGVAASGEYEERLPIADGCTGIIVGKKGANLKEIQKKFKVQVKLEGVAKKDGTPSTGTPEVVITGPCHRDVQAAAKELDLFAEDVDVPREMAGWVCGKGNRHLKLIRELTGVTVLSMARDPEAPEVMPGFKTHVLGNVAEDGDGDGEDGDVAEDGDMPGEPEPIVLSATCKIMVRGKRSDVKDARLCLETHMGYYPVAMEMQKVEQDLDGDLRQANARLGRKIGQGVPPSSNNGRGNGRVPSPGREVAGNASKDANGGGRGEGGRSGRGRGRGVGKL